MSLGVDASTPSRRRSSQRKSLTTRRRRGRTRANIDFSPESDLEYSRNSLGKF